MNKLFESVEILTPYTTRYTFAPRTAVGETLVVDFTYCESTNSAGDLAHLWHKNGYTSRVLPTHWAVSTYATENNAYRRCRGVYNPTVKPGTHKLNFNWVLEATNDNRVALLNEIMCLAGINSRIVTRSVWNSRDFDSLRIGDHASREKILEDRRKCLEKDETAESREGRAAQKPSTA